MKAKPFYKNNKHNNNMDSKEKENINEEELKAQAVPEENGEEATEKEEVTLTEEEKLAQELEKAHAEIEDQKDKYLRLSAEFDNYRKRTMKEKAELILNGGEKSISSILPIVDDFERALKNMETATDVAAVKEGVELIYNKFITVLGHNGVKVIETKEGDINTVLICSHPILITARYININENTETVVIAYTIGDKWNFISVERERIASNTKIVNLANFSIDITSDTAKDIIKYLQYILQVNSSNIPIYKAVNRLGWVNNEFVPYSDKIKCDSELNFKDIIKQLKSKGNFEVWQKHCLLLRENIYLRLVMAASFSAPLIERIGGLPFIVHLWGGTGTGKTVALCVAASVWGKGAYNNNALIQSFRGTEYALSEKAAFLYSLPVIIDEGQTVKNKDDFDTLIMNLTEGKGKIQGSASGGIKKLRHWANCFITTAEENIIKYNSGGGTSNRIINIAAQSKIINDGHITMQIIRDNYGFAGKEYIEYIKKLPLEQLKNRYDDLFAKLKDNTDSTDKQLMAMTFLLLSDELSEQCIFKGEKPLSIENIKPFLTSQKEIDNSERAYNWAVNWVSQNMNRFKDSINNNGEVWGKIKDDVAIINKNVLTEYLQRAGFDYGAVMPELAKRNKLIKTPQGKWLHSMSVYGCKASYVQMILNDNEYLEVKDDVSPF